MNYEYQKQRTLQYNILRENKWQNDLHDEVNDNSELKTYQLSRII